MCHGRADPQAAAPGARDTAKLVDRAKADDVTGTEEPLPHEEHRRGAARHDMRVLAITLEERESLADRSRRVVVEAHVIPAARPIARSMP